MVFFGPVATNAAGSAFCQRVSGLKLIFFGIRGHRRSRIAILPKWQARVNAECRMRNAEWARGGALSEMDDMDGMDEMGDARAEPSAEAPIV